MAKGGIKTPVGKFESLYLGGTLITATADEINGIVATDCSTEELDILHGATVTTDELNFVHGVTSAIQTQLDGKIANLTEATPVNAVAASGTLTISGVCIDGETVTIGDDTYEFAADEAQTVTEGNIATDITSYTTAAQGTLTMSVQPTSGDTVLLGSKTYTFVPDGTENADGEVSVGGDLAGAKVNIVAAINGTDGISTANADVSAAAFSENDCVITALVGGIAGNSLDSVYTGDTNAFDAATLGTTDAGVDCSAANAVTALVTAITASGTEPVSAADGDGDTVVITADTKGIAANSIATTEECANAAWGAETMTLGVDGTVSSGIGLWHYDANYLYWTVAANTVADTNWRRIALGSAY